MYQIQSRIKTLQILNTGAKYFKANFAKYVTLICDNLKFWLAYLVRHIPLLHFFTAQQHQQQLFILKKDLQQQYTGRRLL